jgi:hypothetical protein
MHSKINKVIGRAHAIKEIWEGKKFEELHYGDLLSMWKVFNEMLDILERLKIAIPLPIYFEKYKSDEEVLQDYFVYLRDTYIKRRIDNYAGGYAFNRPNEIDLNGLYDFLKFAGFGGRCLYCGKYTQNRFYGLPFCNKEHYEKMKKMTSWYYVRKEYLKKHPTCEVCRMREAVEVHHIIRAVDGGDIWDENNLIAVCKECHKKLHSPIGEEHEKSSRICEAITGE